MWSMLLKIEQRDQSEVFIIYLENCYSFNCGNDCYYKDYKSLQGINVVRRLFVRVIAMKGEK